MVMPWSTIRDEIRTSRTAYFRYFGFRHKEKIPIALSISRREGSLMARLMRAVQEKEA
jgi:hypothetical protein